MTSATAEPAGAPRPAPTAFGPREADALAERRSTRQRRMAAALLALPCAAYLLIELVYVLRLPLGMDELHGSGTVYKLRHQVPYVDFSPYKNVLGYYVQLPFMLLGRGIWGEMIAIKLGMAAITGACVYGCAVALARRLRLHSVLLATVLLFCMSTFLERSAELRVDMLTALAGLVSLVALLSHRFALAGALAGVSFLLSQKGVFFGVAGGVALLARFVPADRPRGALRDGLVFGASAALPVALYFALFSALASFSTVTERSLGVAREMATLELYRTLNRFWWQTASHNPLFYGLAVLGLGAAFERSQRGGRDAATDRDRMLWSYGATVLVLCLSHKQPWPYFFVLLIPTLWVVLAVTIEALPRKGWPFWAAIALLGVVLPLGRADDVLARDSAYLRYTLETADRLLAPGERYLAGIDMLHAHDQPRDMSWLDTRKLEVLQRRGAEPLLVELRRRPPKLLIWNYRLENVPELVRRHLRLQYKQFWASIYTYAPTCENERCELAFSGRYALRDLKPAVIDGHKLTNGRSIRLRAGVHQTDRKNVRLQWLPDAALQKSLDPAMRRERRLFDNVYDF